MEVKNPIVTIEMENGDVMKAELYPEIAPNTVNNFVQLIKDGYYIPGNNLPMQAVIDILKIDIDKLERIINLSK